MREKHLEQANLKNTGAVFPNAARAACRRILPVLITAALAAVSLPGCTTPPDNSSVTMSGMYFDTVVQIEAWGASEEVMEHCKEMCAYYEELLSATIETSEVSKIN